MIKALILGIGGQDGSYLAEHLLGLGNYKVYGMYRRSSIDNLQRISHIKEVVELYQGDLLDLHSLETILEDVQPNEIYNLADQDHVGYSLQTPIYSHQVTYGGVVNLLTACRNSDIRIFQPCTALMFGTTPKQRPQTLDTPLNPQSPYAIAKTAAYHLCKHHREYYANYISTGILYNHDSIRRQGDYLLHKIANATVELTRNANAKPFIPYPNNMVTIASAEEVVKAMHLSLQQESAGDYLIGSDVPYPILSLVYASYNAVGIPIGSLPSLLGHYRCLIPDLEQTTGNLGWWPVNDARDMVIQITKHKLELASRGKA